MKKTFILLSILTLIFLFLGFYLGSLDNAPFPLWPSHYPHK